MVILSLEDFEQLTVGQPPEERTPQQVFASESPLCDYRPNSRSNKNAAVIGPQRKHETSSSLDRPEARARWYRLPNNRPIACRTRQLAYARKQLAC
jgi:hypothetical protein